MIAAVPASAAFAAQHPDQLQLALASPDLLARIALMVVVGIAVLAKSAAELRLTTFQARAADDAEDRGFADDLDR